MHMNKNLEILLVEDNLLDAELTKAILSTYKFNYNLHMVYNGEDAMSFLYKEMEFKSAPTPDFIILDLNLPKKDGREVLIEVKHNDKLKHIPIVILTSSTDMSDIKMVYDNYANAYMTKPLNMIQFDEIMQSLQKYWMSNDLVVAV